MYLIINRVFIDSYTDDVLSSTLLYVHIKDLVLFSALFTMLVAHFYNCFLSDQIQNCLNTGNVNHVILNF